MPRRLTLRPRELGPIDPTLGPGPTTQGNPALGGRVRPGAGPDGAGGNNTSSRFGDRFPGRPDRSGPGPAPPGGGAPPRTGRPPTPPRQTPQDFPEIWWSGDRAPLAIIYGRARVRCFPVTMVQDGDKLVFLYIIGLGPITAVDDVYINSQEFDSAAEEFDGWTINEYLGTGSQTADPLLSAAITGSPGYTDALDGSDSTTGLGSAYLAISAPVGSVSGVPFVEVIAQGRAVTDPRTSPQTVAYSTNPSLILADIIESDLYGWGRDVNESSLADAANANDETVGGAKRRELGLVLYEPREALSVVQEIAEYAAVIMDREGDRIRFVPDRPRAVDLALNDKDHIISSRYTRKRATDVPEAVEVAWYDVEAGREKEVRAPNDDAATAIIRARLTGIPTYAQAKREAIERYNRERLEDLSGEIVIAGRGLVVQVGDVVSITDRTIAVTDKPFRVLSVRIQQPGVFRIGLVEYQPGVYSDDVTAEPESEDTGLPGVFTPQSAPVLAGGGENVSIVRTDNDGDPQVFEYFIPVARSDDDPGPGVFSVQVFRASDDVLVSHTILEGEPREANFTGGPPTPEKYWNIRAPTKSFEQHKAVVRRVYNNGLYSSPLLITSTTFDNRAVSRFAGFFNGSISGSRSGDDLTVTWGSGMPYGFQTVQLYVQRISPSAADPAGTVNNISLSATESTLSSAFVSGAEHTFIVNLLVQDQYGREVNIGAELIVI